MQCQIGTYPPGVEIKAPVSPAFSEILTPEALAFVAELHRQFDATRISLLKKRAERQAELDAGKRPTFLPETEHIRNSDWTIARYRKIYRTDGWRLRVRSIGR